MSLDTRRRPTNGCREAIFPLNNDAMLRRPGRLETALIGCALLIGAIGGCQSEAPPPASPADSAGGHSTIAAEQPEPVGKVLVNLPKDAADVRQTATELEFKLPAGTAATTVMAWREQFARAGWIERSVIQAELTGTILFVRAAHQLTLTYADTEVVPADVLLQADGVELVVADPQ
jgi:hypothetical protein